jgi:DNA-binding NarL/FixJ family response regulator
MSKRVFLADDHEIMREGLSVLLRKNSDMEVVGQAADGRNAVKMACELRPDVVLMDIAMPNLNGIEATRQLISKLPNAKVMALSTHSSKSVVVKMLRAGASGYMLKDSAFEELITGINAMIEGRTYLCTKIANVVLSDYMNMLADPKRYGGDELTPREREVLQLVAEGATTKDIASGLHVSVKTVDSHREHIMNKLNIHNVAELTKYAIREGVTFL